VRIPAAERRIWLCVAPTNLRRSFDGLAALARNHLGEDTADGSRFEFVNRRRTIVKVLSFDGGATGRLREGRRIVSAARRDARTRLHCHACNAGRCCPHSRELVEYIAEVGRRGHCVSRRGVPKTGSLGAGRTGLEALRTSSQRNR